MILQGTMESRIVTSRYQQPATPAWNEKWMIRMMAKCSVTSTKIEWKRKEVRTDSWKRTELLLILKEMGKFHGEI